MKKIVASIIAGVVFCFGTFNLSNAQDGFFSDAQTLRQGSLSLGIQSAIYTEIDNEVMLFFRGAYGINPGLTLHGKVGVLREETYLGGHIESQLAGEPSDPISFSLIGGIYAFGDLGLKAGGILSKQLGQVSLFSGLTFEPLFSEPETLTPLLIPVGFDINLGNNANFVLEADMSANDDADFYQALHFGFNFYL